MQHLDEGTIHAWIDGELSPEQAVELETHVRDCTECAAAVAEARGLVAASTRILTALDHVPGGVIPSVPDIAPAQLVPRRWYQRMDVRAAAALLFVAGASVLVARTRMDLADSRAMIATADKAPVASSVAAEIGDAGSAEGNQKATADVSSASPAPAATAPAATAPAIAESPSTRPLASREAMPGAPQKSSFAEARGPTSRSLQPKVMADEQPPANRIRSESQLSKEEATKTRGADAVNAPPAAMRVGAAAPPMPIGQAGIRSGTARTGGIAGRVTDKNDGRGVPNAQVIVEGTTLSVATDKDGKFRIENVPQGAQQLRVRSLGYTPTGVPLTVEPSQVTAARVGLTPSQTTLEEVVVTSAEGTPVTAMMGAAINKAVATAPLRVLRADSTMGTKRTVYEVSRGVEVSLTESKVEAVAERDNAADDSARRKVAAPQRLEQASAARQDEKLSGAVAGALAAPAAPILPLNSITWIERGRRYVLTGRLTTKDLEALKGRLIQTKR